MADETSVNVDARYDPLVQRMEGVAIHGNTPFSVPIVSRVDRTLWQGGCARGLILPREIEFVVDLYCREPYRVTHDVRAVLSVPMYDAALANINLIATVARTINGFRALGPTLVHCQAGLNRSGLLCASAMILAGTRADHAIDKLRTARSPAVLCNPVFEKWLRDEATEALLLCV